MKVPLILVVSGLVSLTAFGCTTSRTSTEAPAGTNQSATAPSTQEANQAKSDAMSDVRKAQIESDIRAREQRNQITGGDTDRADADLESEVRGKLEANIPAGQLTVDAKDGVVTVAGTVPAEDQIAKVDQLPLEIKGVKQVVNQVVVAAATPKPSK